MWCPVYGSNIVATMKIFDTAVARPIDPLTAFSENGARRTPRAEPDLASSFAVSVVLECTSPALVARINTLKRLWKVVYNAARVQLSQLALSRLHVPDEALSGVLCRDSPW